MQMRMRMQRVRSLRRMRLRGFVALVSASGGDGGGAPSPNLAARGCSGAQWWRWSGGCPEGSVSEAFDTRGPSGPPTGLRACTRSRPREILPYHRMCVFFCESGGNLIRVYDYVCVSCFFENG